MSSIIGFDYDSNGVYAVAIDEDAGDWLGTWRADLGWMKDADSADRVRALAGRMPARSSWADAGVVAFAMEDLRSKQRASVAALARVEGALLAGLPTNIEVVRLSVNRRVVGWKALTVGKTNASKDEIKAWATANGAPAGLVQDFYDAFAIARAARELLNLRQKGAA